MTENMTIKQAYSAMYCFLEQCYEMNHNPYIGMLLSDLSLLEDESPADPAIWTDWLKAVEKAMSGNTDIHLRLNG